MNAVYLVFVNIGVYLAPVVAGYSAVSQGWPWIYWWCAIFLGINVLLMFFFYEETKYVVTLQGLKQTAPSTEPSAVVQSEKASTEVATDAPVSANSTSHINHSIPMNSYKKRLAFVTNTPSTFSEFLKHFYQPLLMLGIPGVLYVALQYGAFLSWISMVAVTESDFFSTDPYNFSTIGIGLLNLPPFVGAVVAAFYSGPLSDWSILWLSRRNGGVYEPEMRLYLTVLPMLVGPAGLMLYGFSLSHVRFSRFVTIS
jgi:Major Facilitator Superfamily